MNKSIMKFTFAVLLIAASSNVAMAQENEDGEDMAISVLHAMEQLGLQ